MVLIEKATLADLGDLQRLEKACFPLDAWPILDLVGVLLLPGILRLKATQAGRMAGFVAADVAPSKPVVWIATIGVFPEFQRQGIGADLLKAVEGRVAQPEIRLTVRKSNLAAIQLYLHHGYRQVEVWYRYYEGGEDGIVMAKERGAANQGGDAEP